MSPNITPSDQSPLMVLEGPTKPHLALLPFFTTSHMIPMVELGRQLAAHGAKVTIITTPSNAAVFQSSIDQTIASGHQISAHTLKFPSAEVNLPEGIENYSAITSPDMLQKVAHGIILLQNPMEKLINNLSPDCIVSDMFFPWTVDTSEKLNIPRLLFYPSNIFNECVSYSLKSHNPHERTKDDLESFLIPGLPDKIEMRRSQLPDYLKTKTKYGELIDLIKGSETRSHGIIFDSFHELEASYIAHYKDSTGLKVWHVGPLSYYSKPDINKKDSPPSDLNSWLNAQKAKTVLYISFGSMAMLPDKQLTEIALALEHTEIPFIWVVRHGDKSEEKMLAESNRGIVIRGWAPQVEILNHPAVGGCVTHCGWNSVMECVMAGVPLITWPLFAEQFFNEKFIVDVLRIGIRVGSEDWNPGFEITSPVVGREKIEKAVEFFMGCSGEIEAMRRRVVELRVAAATAVEDGGSSRKDLVAVIKEVQDCVGGKVEE